MKNISNIMKTGGKVGKGYNKTSISRHENLNIEYYRGDNQECHLCGLVKKGRYFIHLYYLCQHYIALCPRCFSIFKFRINKFNIKKGGK